MLKERLEVRVSEDTMIQLREAARQRGVSVAQLVRDALEHLLELDKRARLAAAEAMFEIDAPVGSWEAMKAEIETGYHESGGSA